MLKGTAPLDRRIAGSYLEGYERRSCLKRLHVAG